ncbi:hypothetical protein [Sphingomicrobium arenosum]|uniref:hypothetical protein n=1 Tax=Sphingomicrobium arenosum TaxID=2233861 RepID=UPI00223FF320|nr:hypothetical protein [Sphingomicrobium arenosum]
MTRLASLLAAAALAACSGAAAVPDGMTAIPGHPGSAFARIDLATKLASPYRGGREAVEAAARATLGPDVTLTAFDFGDYHFPVMAEVDGKRHYFILADDQFGQHPAYDHEPRLEIGEAVCHVMIDGVSLGAEMVLDEQALLGGIGIGQGCALPREGYSVGPWTVEQLGEAKASIEEEVVVEIGGTPYRAALVDLDPSDEVPHLLAMAAALVDPSMLERVRAAAPPKGRRKLRATLIERRSGGDILYFPADCMLVPLDVPTGALDMDALAAACDELDEKRKERRRAQWRRDGSPAPIAVDPPQPPRD